MVMSLQTPMFVTFIRTGERSYAVQAAVNGMPVLEMNPAPGYDARMPHDLQHFIVERALGIKGAIYGQLAAGGTADTFRPLLRSGKAREATRDQRQRALKSKRVKSAQQGDNMRSERATYVCWHDWLNHSDKPELRAQASAMQHEATNMFLAMSHLERATYTNAKLNEIRDEFSKLSERWCALRIGESFTEPW